MFNRRNRKLIRLVALAFVSGWIGRAAIARTGEASGRSADADARRKARDYIAADESISLSETQKAVMTEALSSMPAPCCADYSMATCCCPCNLAKSTWGLSKVLITRHHAKAPEVTRRVKEWLASLNPDGFTGNACFTQGGCNRSFDHNGCGGMDAKRVL